MKEGQRNVLWVVGTANFVERFNQSILVVGLEGNAKIDWGAIRGSTQMPPFVRSDIPKMSNTHINPT